MSKEARENKRLRIRQKHLIAAAEETERLLRALDNDIQETIELYEKNGWKVNKNFERWQDKVKHAIANIVRRREAFKLDKEDTVRAERLDQYE